jgi:ribonuclease VapC
MNDRYVLDSSAVIALLGNEKGADDIDAVLPNAVISTVNLAEVISKLQERGGSDQAIDDSLADLNLTVISFDSEQANKAGKMRNITRARGLSLGDRACLALAASRGATAVTTDKAWKDFEQVAQVLVVR